MLSTRIFDIIVDSSIHIRMTDRVSNIMTYISTEIGKRLFSLLPRCNKRYLFYIYLEKRADVVLMHVRAYIAVVSMAENRNIVEKYIRSLKT